jgi:hypothetical protein
LREEILLDCEADNRHNEIINCGTLLLAFLLDIGQREILSEDALLDSGGFGSDRNWVPVLGLQDYEFYRDHHKVVGHGQIHDNLF